MKRERKDKSVGEKRELITGNKKYVVDEVERIRKEARSFGML
jgi:hypothetical protein